MPPTLGGRGWKIWQSPRPGDDRRRRLFLWRKIQIRDLQLPGKTNLRLVLGGCLADFCIFFYRMKCRCHTYPMAYAAKLGPICRRDANGDLQRCTLAPLYMQDIEDYEAAHPGATVFDLEIFFRGWEKGAESASHTHGCRTSLQEEMAREDCAPRT